jgi:hypothetical protein
MFKACLLEEMKQTRLQSSYDVILRKRIIPAMVEIPITKKAATNSKEVKFFYVLKFEFRK